MKILEHLKFLRRVPKGGYFSEIAILSSISKKIFQITIQNLNLKLLTLMVNNLFEFQSQNNDLEYFFLEI